MWRISKDPVEAQAIQKELRKRLGEPMRLGGPQADNAPERQDAPLNDTVDQRLIQSEGAKRVQDRLREQQGLPPIPDAPQPDWGGPNKLADAGSSKHPLQHVIDFANSWVKNVPPAVGHAITSPIKQMMDYQPGDQGIGKAVFDVGASTLGVGGATTAVPGLASNAGGKVPVTVLVRAYRGNPEFEALANSKYRQLQGIRDEVGMTEASQTAASIAKHGTPEDAALGHLVKTSRNGELGIRAEEMAAAEMAQKSGIKDFNIAGMNDEGGTVVSAFGAKPKGKGQLQKWTQEQKDDFISVANGMKKEGRPAKEAIQWYRKKYGEGGPSDNTLGQMYSKNVGAAADRYKYGETPRGDIARREPPTNYRRPESAEPTDLPKPEMSIMEMKTPEQFARNYFNIMEPGKGKRPNLEMGKMIADHAAQTMSQAEYNQFIRILNDYKSGRYGR